MDITIIVDKSTFQSLAFDEVYRLSRYYKHIITPVLALEILGDLKKEMKEGQPLSQDRVKDFANKLFPTETVVNLHYKILLKGELLGNPVFLDGRPHVGIEKAVTSESGQKGYIIEESPEEKSIHKWKDGKFSEADHELSALWRMKTTQENLLEQLKKSLTPNNVPKFKDFNELNEFVESRLNDPKRQQLFLTDLIINYEIDAQSSVEIFGRWHKEGKPLIKNFAPYAFHCLKVDTLFLFGLLGNLIGTKPTNRIDLEYLYYLPVANIFTSNDKVHKALVPLLLRPDQKFIVGTDLKNDLKNIVEYLKSLSDEERKNFNNDPPVINDSLTFQLWKEYFGYPERSNWNRKISEERVKMMREKMKEFERAYDGEATQIIHGEDGDFILKKSFIKKNDLCPCGSGKKVIDCHLPEKEFEKVAFEQWLKDQKKERGGE